MKKIVGALLGMNAILVFNTVAYKIQIDNARNGISDVTINYKEGGCSSWNKRLTPHERVTVEPAGTCCIRAINGRSVSGASGGQRSEFTTNQGKHCGNMNITLHDSPDNTFSIVNSR